jgi:parallel beta-helix repeat protein
MLILETMYGNFSGNVIANNAESGVLVRGTDTIMLSGNFIHGNGLTGINIQDSRASLFRNTISWNGVRGIGIQSVAGEIAENVIVKNGLYAIDIEGGDVSAPLNWLGAGATPHDKEDNQSKGKVVYAPLRQDPPVFLWPLDTIGTDVIWDGTVNVPVEVLVPRGVSLSISPGTKVLFSKGAGLKIEGGVSALGKRDARIIFSSLDKAQPSSWGELLLDHASPGIFEYSDFEAAAWAVHSHFTNLKVTNCRFFGNQGGIRFRSGPVEITHSEFTGNSIGIRAYRGSAIIAENNITSNETGIFVREKGGGLKVMRNNIFENSGYGIRLGDFNDEDVPAPDNYWGSKGPGETIFDASREPGIGRVLVDPISIKPHPASGAGI